MSNDLPGGHFADPETELAFLGYLASAWPLWRAHIGSQKWHDLKGAFIAGCAGPAATAGWQPIETAPKDGTAAIIGFWYRGRFVQYQGFWTEAGWMENSRTYFPSHMQKWL